MVLHRGVPAAGPLAQSPRDTPWSEFNSLAGTPLEPGSHGTYAYDADGHLVLDEPCCGKTVLEWSLDGDQLTMTPVAPIEATGVEGTLMGGGTWTRAE